LTQPARILPLNTIRHSSTARPLTQDADSRTETDAEREAKNAERRKNEEAYRITFTCKPCGERSSHRMSKQGYHRGTVLIQCPSCQNRHVMSDHLGVFFDKGTTLEDLLKEKGQALTHGHTDGDLEFWADGTVKSFDLQGQELLGSAGKESGKESS
jgi:protein import protein ZIM17